MSQATITLDCNKSGTQYTTDATTALAAIDSMHSGASAPTLNVVDGKLWLDTSGSDNVIRIRVGTAWFPLLDFDGSDWFAERAKRATTADALTTARTIAIDGDVDAPATSFDGSGNITLTTTYQSGTNAVGTRTIRQETGTTPTGGTSGDIIYEYEP